MGNNKILKIGNKFMFNNNVYLSLCPTITSLSLAIKLTNNKILKIGNKFMSDNKIYESYGQ